jgi:hypothetical protein
MQTSQSFEQQVHRIHELLERSCDEVIWNDHIPDPDNPSQLRQIDVTIRRAGKLTIIECRRTRSRQGVKWIEELIGRRQSLDAHDAIAVASAGFSKGARRKAASYGIVLRDLRQLSDNEISNWGCQTTLISYRYQYSDVRFSVGFAAESLPRIDVAMLAREIQSHDLAQTAFNSAAAQLDTLNLMAKKDMRTVGFGVAFRVNSVALLCGEPVLQIALEGKACLVAQTVVSSTVLAYGEPTQAADERRAIVERFGLGETSIVHDDDRVSMDVDLSAMEQPPLSQLRYFCPTQEREMELDFASFAIMHPERLRVICPLKMDIHALRSDEIASIFNPVTVHADTVQLPGAIQHQRSRRAQPDDVVRTQRVKT